MKLRLVFLLLSCSAGGHACPFCRSETAGKIRAVLFGPGFVYQLLLTLLPFLIFFIIVFLIYHGGWPSGNKAEQTPNAEP